MPGPPPSPDQGLFLPMLLALPGGAVDRRTWINLSSCALELLVLPNPGRSELGNLHLWQADGAFVLGRESFRHPGRSPRGDRVLAPGQPLALPPNRPLEVGFTTTLGWIRHHLRLRQGADGPFLDFELERSWLADLRGRPPRLHPLLEGGQAPGLPRGTALDRVVDLTGLERGELTILAPFAAAAGSVVALRGMVQPRGGTAGLAEE